MHARVRMLAALALPLLVLGVDAARDANAQQLVMGEDGREISVDVPAKGLTLFKTRGAKLLKVRHLEGDVAIETDADKGEVTIRPLKASGVAALFLVTETATIPVNAHIDKDGVGAKSIIVHVPELPAPVPAPPAPKVAKAWVGPPQEYVRTIKNMVVAATSDVVEGANYQVERRGRALPPLDQLHVFHESNISASNGFVARKYIISNPTNQRLVLDERRLAGPEVMAVAIERAELQPGDATVAVVVLREE